MRAADMTVESGESLSPSPRPLPASLAWLIIASVALLPVVDFGFSQPLISLLPKRNLHIALFDLLIWPAAIWLLAWYWRNSGIAGWKKSWLRPWLTAVWPGLLLLAAGLASTAQTGFDNRQALLLAAKNACQCVEYLVVFPLAAMALIAEAKWRKRLATALLFGVALAAATALWDFSEFARQADQGIPHLVGGCLGNRYLYTLFTALALCLLWEEVCLPGWSMWRWPLAFAAFYPALAAGPLVAGLAGLALAAMMKTPRSLTAVLALIAALAFLPPAEARSLRGRCLARSLQVYVPFRHPETGNLESTHTMRYYRWTAEINLIASRPWGAGWGGYQSAINAQLGDLPTPKIQSDAAAAYDILAHEPMSFSWFLQSGVEFGLLGLAAVFIFILEILARASAGRGRQGTLPGVAGAAIVLLVAGLWTSPMARGVGPLLGLILALSRSCPAAAADEKEKI